MSTMTDEHGKEVQVLYFNEACALCGVPADMHLGQSDEASDLPCSPWGDISKCRTFTRHNPPRPAYGGAWWNGEPL